MKNKNCFNKIRNIVKQIPKGKVSTYGEVANAVGISSARVVGWALRGNQNPLIPCHRVVQKGGTLSPHFSLGGSIEQKKRLKKDGVVFIDKNQVDMDKCFFSYTPLAGC